MIINNSKFILHLSVCGAEAIVMLKVRILSGILSDFLFFEKFGFVTLMLCFDCFFGLANLP